MPTAAATRAATAALSPVSRMGRRPSAFSRATAAADPALTVSLRLMIPAAFPVHGDADGRCAALFCRCERGLLGGVQNDPVLLQPAAPPGHHGPALNGSRHSAARR